MLSLLAEAEITDSSPENATISALSLYSLHSGDNHKSFLGSLTKVPLGRIANYREDLDNKFFLVIIFK